MFGLVQIIITLHARKSYPKPWTNLACLMMVDARSSMAKTSVILELLAPMPLSTVGWKIWAWSGLGSWWGSGRGLGWMMLPREGVSKSSRHPEKIDCWVMTLKY